MTYEYHGTVTLEVEAEDEDAAEAAGIDEADEAIQSSLSIYDIKVREA